MTRAGSEQSPSSSSAVKDEKTKVRSAVLPFEHNQTCPAFIARPTTAWTELHTTRDEGMTLHYYYVCILCCCYTLSRIKHKKLRAYSWWLAGPSLWCSLTNTGRTDEADGAATVWLSSTSSFTDTIIVLGLSGRQMAAIITQFESALVQPFHYIIIITSTNQVQPSVAEQDSNSVQRKQFVKDICIRL